MYIFFITRINKESPIISAIITVKHGYNLSFFSLFLLIVMLYFPYIKTYIQLSVCVCAYMHVQTCYVCMCVHVSRSPKISVTLNPVITSQLSLYMTCQQYLTQVTTLFLEILCSLGSHHPIFSGFFLLHHWSFFLHLLCSSSFPKLSPWTYVGSNSLGNLFQFHGSKYHLPAENSQMYISQSNSHLNSGSYISLPLSHL